MLFICLYFENNWNTFTFLSCSFWEKCNYIHLSAAPETVSSDIEQLCMALNLLSASVAWLVHSLNKLPVSNLFSDNSLKQSKKKEERNLACQIKIFFKMSSIFHSFQWKLILPCSLIVIKAGHRWTWLIIQRNNWNNDTLSSYKSRFPSFTSWDAMSSLEQPVTTKYES